MDRRTFLAGASALPVAAALPAVAVEAAPTYQLLPLEYFMFKAGDRQPLDMSRLARHAMRAFMAPSNVEAFRSEVEMAA